MIAGLLFQLAQAGKQLSPDVLGGFAVLGILIGAPIALFVYFKLRTARVSESLARRNYDDNERRNQAAFDHNLDAAKLNNEKQKLEIKLLQLQIQLAEHEISARLENSDIGDLMTEKTRLEIESLRLHIRDQRKGGLPDYDD